MIRITAKVDGFRRAGLAHPAKPTDYQDDQFDEKQLAALQAEPMLVVELISDESAAAGNADAKVTTTPEQTDDGQAGEETPPSEQTDVASASEAEKEA